MHQATKRIAKLSDLRGDVCTFRVELDHITNITSDDIGDKNAGTFMLAEWTKTGIGCTPVTGDVM